MGLELQDLDARSREVLASVICTYIRSATPVSSRQLEKAGNFALSAASIRNAMADLEDLGFLTHPHVSAGRVPTDRGYRAFVGELMTPEPPDREVIARIEEELGGERFEMDRFLRATSRVLSRLTGEVGVVAAPGSARFVLGSVHVTRVAERKALALLVSLSGLVDSRLLELQEDVAQPDLDALSRRLTSDYAGRSLEEVRRLLVASLAEERTRLDAALRRMLELSNQVFAETGSGDETLMVEGTERILGKPEFSGDLDGLRRMFRVFDEKTRLLELLTGVIAAGGSGVVIGSESAFTDETSSAVVAAAYGSGGRVLGALGVVGPKRMEYARIVPLVEELGHYVTKRLGEGRA